MNVEVSRRVGAVMSTMRQSLTRDQIVDIMTQVETATSFNDLSLWAQQRVIAAERLIASGQSGLS